MLSLELVVCLFLIKLEIELLTFRVIVIGETALGLNVPVRLNKSLFSSLSALGLDDDGRRHTSGSNNILLEKMVSGSSFSGVSLFELDVGRKTGLESESSSSSFYVKLFKSLVFYVPGNSEPELNTVNGVLFLVESCESGVVPDGFLVTPFKLRY